MIMMIRADVLTDLVKNILEASLSGLATAIHLSRNELFERKAKYIGNDKISDMKIDPIFKI